MRYRVEAADRPDGLYAAWHESVYSAQRSTEDGTLLLVVLEGEETPEGFDREWEGRPARVVPDGEASTTFSLQTHCRYDDEIYQVAPHTGGTELTLRWTGQDPARAAELGLVDFSTSVSPKQVTGLWQARHDFAEEPAEEDAGPGTGDQSALLRGIGRTLLRVLPAGWQRVGAQFRQVGDYAELEVRSVGDEGSGSVSVSISAPPQLSALFVRLRAAMCRPGTGTWFQGTFTLDSASQFDFDFDAENEPNWRLAPNEGGRPSPRSYAAELATFPRDSKHLPAWLAAKAGLPLDVEFRHAKVVDAHNEGERPVLTRPPLAPEAVRGVLDYLFRSPVAVTRPGPQPDIFTPGGPADVPNAFHTDGSWIWPAAVPHYLRKYGVPPEPELVEHIRASGFRPPYVSDRLRATAEAEILGKPRPARSESDLPDEDVLSRIAREGEPARDLRAADALTVLHQRLAEHGVAPTAYRIGALPADGVWTLRKAENGWEVSRPPTDEPVAFEHLEEAARFLLGTLLLYPARAAAGAPEETAQPADAPVDWPILPLRGEPPLTFYRGKRIVVLPAGSTVQRFGPETGNVVHTASARFAETSLAFERERDRRLYRVQRPLRVLTGTAAPWGGQPGGATAYVLPRPIAQHVENGALSRV
ncbi:TNT domain-containing protein [Amycolatopsis sp. H20-H5]|uniref:TNT domain-containing protein n=1 Tax=Amycolatopsis sp. H20-H5 TaxID=3046309 RepID=UPI002DBA03BF|nr:TNT domain-containing protein [Amycolatopsis sp. H20-H5]MEC3974640.1 TNT domain-containing protein [Amycolatopsis sp. H20-H5]